MGAAILRALEIPTSQILAVTDPVAPAIRADDARFQYWGRWDQRNSGTSGAVTVNTGSTILLQFQGTQLTLHFTTTQYSHQVPTLWLEVDDGDWNVVNPVEELSVAKAPLPAGKHVVQIGRASCRERV